MAALYIPGQDVAHRTSPAGTPGGTASLGNHLREPALAASAHHRLRNPRVASVPSQGCGYIYLHLRAALLSISRLSCCVQSYRASTIALRSSLFIIACIAEFSFVCPC